MTYIVTDNCIKCKYMDCVEVCPVDCFYEGENMLVIHPDECIDCGVCEPECPAEAIKPDTEPGLDKWLELNTEYADKWPNITLGIVREGSGKLLTDSINFLIEKDKWDLLEESFGRWVAEQGIKSPILLWIVKNRHSKKFGRVLAGLMTPRLLSAIFYAIDYEALQKTTNKRILLADVLSDDRDLIPDLLADADVETAKDLAQSLLSNQGFEELTKKSLLARFIRQFPTIQDLVTGDSKDDSKDDLIVSQPSFDARQAEYKRLIEVKIPENKEAIATAREHDVLLAQHDLLRRHANAMQRGRAGRGDGIVDALDLEGGRQVRADGGGHAFRHGKRSDPLGRAGVAYHVMCGEQR